VEFPHIEKLVDKYSSKGFVVLTLNTIPSADATGKLMMAKKGYKFTHLTTPDNNWATKNYQFEGAPTTVLLDANGKVILRHLGYSLEGIRAMDQAIAHLLESARANR
jgi:hypothetical protein